LHVQVQGGDPRIVDVDEPAADRGKSRRKKMNFCMSVLQIQIAVKRKVLPALQKLGLLQLE
jgi:hypothetical protein